MYFCKKYYGTVDATPFVSETINNTTTNHYYGLSDLYGEILVDFFNIITDSEHYANYDSSTNIISIDDLSLKLKAYLISSGYGTSAKYYCTINFLSLDESNIIWQINSIETRFLVDPVSYVISITIKGEPTSSFNVSIDSSLNEISYNFTSFSAKAKLIKNNMPCFLIGDFGHHTSLSPSVSTYPNILTAREMGASFYYQQGKFIDNTGNYLKTRTSINANETSYACMVRPPTVTGVTLTTLSSSSSYDASYSYTRNGGINYLWNEDNSVIPLIPVFSCDGFIKFDNLYWFEGLVDNDTFQSKKESFIKLNDEVYYIHDSFLIRCSIMVNPSYLPSVSNTGLTEFVTIMLTTDDASDSFNSKTKTVYFYDDTDKTSEAIVTTDNIITLNIPVNHRYHFKTDDIGDDYVGCESSNFTAEKYNSRKIELQYKKFTAIVNVTYPGVAECSCYKNFIRYTSNLTNTGSPTLSYSFNVNKKGIWGVEALFNLKNRQITKLVNVEYGKTHNVSINFDYNILDNYTWEQIADAADNGTASTLFKVGDCKKIHIEGVVGTQEINTDLNVVILGIDHNYEIEGRGITFGCFLDLEYFKKITLVDSYYGQHLSNGTKSFNMNHWGNVNYGGWAACDMRYDILGSTNQPPSGYGTVKTIGTTGSNPTNLCAISPVPSTLMSCLPKELRAVMTPITKYTDNVGNKSITLENVTETIDYLPLLSEFEMFGSRSYANSSERNKQQQYEYYALGYSKKMFVSAINNSEYYSSFLRSPYYNDNASFCRCSSIASNIYAYSAIGIAPIFKVGGAPRVEFVAWADVEFPFEATCSCYKSGILVDSSNISPYSFVLRESGTYTFTITAENENPVSEQLTITTRVETKKLSLDFPYKFRPSRVSFETGTEEEIANMLSAHYAGDINISDYWNVGDKRKIHLNNMGCPNSTNYTDPWLEQDIYVVITAIDDGSNEQTPLLYSSIGVRSRAAMVVQTRECINNIVRGYQENGTAYINGTGEHEMSFIQWKNLYLRTWLNSTTPGIGFFSALPTWLQAIIKNVCNKCLTNRDSIITENIIDKIFLPSYTQIFGNTKYAYYINNLVPDSTEGKQWEYYKTSSNRLKQGNNNAENETAGNGYLCNWYMRSPSTHVSASGYYYFIVNGGSNVTAIIYDASTTKGVAPAFAL